MALVVVTLVGAARAAPERVALELVDVTDLRAAASELPVIPWLPEGATLGGASGAGLEAQVGEAAAGVRAWLGITAGSFLLRVEANDDAHVAQWHRGHFTGDSLTVGIDALGDAAASVPGGGTFDDLHARFALTERGPQHWVIEGGRGEGEEEGRINFSARRRSGDAGEQTIYDIAIPWTRFGVVAGASPVVGVALRLDDIDTTAARALTWGAGVAPTVAPRAFRRLRLGDPPSAYVAVWPSRRHVVGEGDAAEILLVVASPENHNVAATWGKTRRSFRVWRSRGQQRLRRLALRARGTAGKGTFEVRVTDPRGALCAFAQVELASALAPLLEVRQVLTALLDGGPPRLLEQHLRSLLGAIETTWGRAMAGLPGHLAAIEAAMVDTQRILAALRGSPPLWEGFRLERRPLVSSFVSAVDGTLQTYLLVLPVGWDARKAYPLTMVLPERDHPRLLGFVADALEERGGVGRAAAAGLDSLVVLPWRGIKGYRPEGLVDLNGAAVDVARRFNVEEDRQYLLGFGAGGSGAWALATRAPAAWAAVALGAADSRWAPLHIGLGSNLAGLAVRVWHGQRDTVVDVDNARALRAELEHAGLQPTVSLVQNVGHVFTSREYQAAMHWMEQHRRRPLASFAYISDTETFRGRSGILMRREASLSPTPRFAAALQGRVVRLRSEGTIGLTVDLGPRGLNLHGEVEVFWNGVPVYVGLPTVLQLGAGADADVGALIW